MWKEYEGPKVEKSVHELKNYNRIKTKTEKIFSYLFDVNQHPHFLIQSMRQWNNKHQSGKAQKLAENRKFFFPLKKKVMLIELKQGQRLNGQKRAQQNNPFSLEYLSTVAAHLVLDNRTERNS